MTRRRVDANQASIVADLRKLGYSVWVTSDLGKGGPDIVCSECNPRPWLRNNWMFEIKDPAQPLSKRKLTSAEQKFHDEWKGQIDVIETIEDALKVMRG